MKFQKRAALLFALLLAVCILLPAIALAEEAAPADRGLYILTPRAPRGTKVFAVMSTDHYDAKTSLEGVRNAVGDCLSLSTQDGNLDGYRLISTTEQIVNGTPEDYPIFYGTGGFAEIGTLFSYYDARGGPSGQFYYAEGISGGALSGLSVIRVGTASCGEENYSFLSPSADPLNRLALHPAASKENPFVLYALDCGSAAVTLDGTAAVSLSVKEGYTALEVRQAALALHKKREAKVLPGEEVVCASSLLPKEQLSPRYGWTYSPLTAAGSAGFNDLLAGQSYPFHGFTFQKVRTPAQTPALYVGTQDVTTELGAFRLEAYVQGERTDVFALLPSGKNRNVYPGDTEESIRVWAEKALQRETLTSRMSAALAGEPNRYCPEARPFDWEAAFYLGDSGAPFDNKDGWYLCQSLWMQKPRGYYGHWNGTILLFACANLPEGADPSKAEISVFGYLRVDETYDRSILLQAEPGETIPSLIGRLREKVPLEQPPFSLSGS